ncbi:hypothetical protein O5699_25745 [Escherichia coli]|nr:hypothetical protein [Escherichia coli]
MGADCRTFTAQLLAQVAARATPFVIDLRTSDAARRKQRQARPGGGAGSARWNGEEGAGLYATGVEWTENAAGYDCRR